MSHGEKTKPDDDDARIKENEHKRTGSRSLSPDKKEEVVRGLVIAVYVNQHPWLS
jgi:hypothetical protein